MLSIPQDKDVHLTNLIRQPSEWFLNNITAVMCTLVAGSRIIPLEQGFCPYTYLKNSSPYPLTVYRYKNHSM